MRQTIDKVKELIKSGQWGLLFKEIDAHAGIGALEMLLSSNWFNPLLTLWINLRSMPFTKAIRFPIFVYGRPKLYSTTGKVEIKGKLKIGMIKFNQSNAYRPGNSTLKSEFFNRGLIVFNGPCTIGVGNKIAVYKEGIFEIGTHSLISEMCIISCFKNIKIGNYFRVAHRSQIMDSGFHYVANFNTRKIPNHTKPITIGDYCWVANTCSLMGGTVLPNHTIVASNSVVNKNYEDIKEGSFIAGAPAKVKAENLYRVYDSDINSILYDFFHIDNELLAYDIDEKWSYNDLEYINN